MTDINHRRQNRPPVNQRYPREQYHNGYAAVDDKETAMQRTGRTDYLDKSLHGWGRISQLGDRVVGASIGNDFCNGHRGMARAVAGAKKFVRSRVRFHENSATRQLARNSEQPEE